MEITLNLQYRIQPEVKWCRLDLARRLGASISDTLHISPPRVEFKVKRDAEDSNIIFDSIVAEIKQLLPEAELKTVYRMRSGGRLPIIMYDSSVGRVTMPVYM